MGQSVEVRSTVEMGDVLLIDTDRSLTGQDGRIMSPDRPGDGVAGQLAAALFDLGLGIDHLHVLQNAVSVKRAGGWDDEAVARVAKTTAEFLRFYDD